MNILDRWNRQLARARLIGDRAAEIMLEARIARLERQSVRLAA